MKTARWGLAASGALLAVALVTTGAAVMADTASGATAGLPPQSVPAPQVVLKSRTAAMELAHNIWFDKMAEANPGLVAAVCANQKAADIIAGHPHLDKIADADHFLCRRLTKYHTA